MGGLFGGFLSLVNVIGGSTLYVLIGISAWKDKRKAREARIGIGSLMLGAIVGIVVYFWAVAGVLKDSWLIKLCIAIGAGFGFMCFVFVLENIRERIDEEGVDEEEVDEE